VNQNDKIKSIDLFSEKGQNLYSALFLLINQLFFII